MHVIVKAKCSIRKVTEVSAVEVPSETLSIFISIYNCHKKNKHTTVIVLTKIE